MRNRYWIDEFVYGIFSKKLDESDPEFFFGGHRQQLHTRGRILKPLLEDKFLMSVKWYTVKIIPIKDDLTPGEAKIIHCKDSSFNIDSATFKDNIILMTSKGNLTLIKLTTLGEKLKLKELQNIKVKGIKGRRERAYTLGISKSGDYMMICMSDEKLMSSSLLVYQIDNSNMIMKSILDIRGSNVSRFSCLKTLRCNSSRSSWIALPWTNDTFNLMTFTYFIERCEIEEEEQYRKEFSGKPIARLVEKDTGVLAGMCAEGRILVLNYS